MKEKLEMESLNPDYTIPAILIRTWRFTWNSKVFGLEMWTADTFSILCPNLSAMSSREHYEIIN